MSLLTRKRSLLAKLESSYGVDASPAAADAMLVKNLTITPIQASLVSRDLIRPFLGNSEQLLTEKSVQIDFEVEYVGSGVVGVAPGYDALLRACGFAKTPGTSTVTLASTGGTVHVGLTAHGFQNGDKVQISGATDVAKNILATVQNASANSFDYLAAGATDEASAAGAPVVQTGTTYKPISTGFESVSLYYNVDGVLHKTVGAIGTVDITLAVKTIPTFKFTFTGLYVPPADVAQPTVDFSKFMIPQVANTQNTPGFTLFGYSGALESMSLSVANEVNYVSLIGKESVQLLDRKPAGTLVFEAPRIAEKDFFSLVSANTSGPMTLDHGSVNGYKVRLVCPSVLLGNPAYQDSNGVQMLSTPFTAQPTSAGNDEIQLLIH